MTDIIKKPYMGLMYGKTGDYYINAINIIYKNYENNMFIWKDLIERTNIDRSMLMRLKCSSWILISDRSKERGTSYRVPTAWYLHPEAINLVRLNLDRKLRLNKKI